jgi:hypothetical protein
VPASTATSRVARSRDRLTRALGRPWILVALVFLMAFGLYSFTTLVFQANVLVSTTRETLGLDPIVVRYHPFVGKPVDFDLGDGRAPRAPP